jgi:CheY-like chemotaxis protein
MSRIVDVLLVEDNPPTSELTLRILRRQHPNRIIHAVPDGAEALDFMFAKGAYADRRGSPPQVIFLDSNIPKLDGLEVLQRLKADPQLSVIPVVMFTSLFEERDLLQSYRLGVNSVVVKPASIEQLTETVQHLGHYWLRLNQSPGR